MFPLQKAIMESDEEWAMNKKLIDLSSRDVRRAVSGIIAPPQCAY